MALRVVASTVRAVLAINDSRTLRFVCFAGTTADVMSLELNAQCAALLGLDVPTRILLPSGASRSSLAAGRRRLAGRRCVTARTSGEDTVASKVEGAKRESGDAVRISAAAWCEVSG